MIVLNKKRMQIILSCVLIAIFAFIFQMTSNKKELKKDSNLEQQKQDTILTTATPVSGKTIVIDARTSECQMNGAQSSSRYNRSRNKFKDCIKTTKSVRD